MKNIKIENSTTVETRFNILNIINTGLIVFALMGSSYFFYYIFENISIFHSRISIAFPIIQFILFLSYYSAFFIKNFETLDKIKTKKIGNYKKGRIRKVFEELIEDNFNEKDEKPNVYIVEDWGNNAFAINSLLMNFMKELNAITISKELFSYLNIPEIRSIMAHEIGHFKRYINIAHRIRFVSSLFVLLSSYSIASTLKPYVSIHGIYLYFICFFIIKFIWYQPLKIYKKDVEFLSDLYSAKRYGKLHMVNSLIKIYQMNNIDILLNIEVAKFIMDSNHLDRNDFFAIQKKLKRKVSRKIYDEELIMNQTKNILSKMKFEKKEALSGSVIKKRNGVLKTYLKKISKMMEDKTVDWKDVDNHKRDGRLDTIEYEGLIKMLKNNPELQLFKTPSDNIKKMKNGSHPVLRRRILFIDKNCPNMGRVDKENYGII